mgnify:CR=1 FL=1
MRKRKNTLRTITLLFVWTLLLVIIPFFVSKVENNRFKNNGSYISSEFEIVNYDVVMDVDRNNRVDVTENIVVNIPGNNFNGIYKSIPKWLKYYNSDGKETKKKIVITNLRAEGEKFVLSETSDSIGIRIGSTRTTANPGLHTYKIMYRYNMGKDNNKDFDELVFNVFDNYDNTKIDNMSVTINMPNNIDDNTVNFFKDKEKINNNIDYSINGNTLVARLSSYQLDDSVTLNMKLPDGYFVGGISNYGIICFIICIALVVLSIYSFCSWSKYGKDFNKYSQTVEFYPPEDLDAAQVGFIYGEKSITKLTTALIIGLASKGYISIEEIGKNKYKIVKTGNNNSKKMSITEQIVYQDLFKNGNNENVISEDPSFAGVFAKVNTCLENVMDKKINDIESRNKMYLTFTLLFIGIVAWVGSYLYIKDLNPSYNIVYTLSFAAIFISGFFAIITNRKTSYGEMISSKVLGFRNYLNTAEKNQLEKLVEDDPNYFYNILPYTYVLNISKKWIDTFGKKNMPNIDLSALEYYENNLFMIMSE